MSETIKMDRAGRVVIPRRIREQYGLVDGAFDLEVMATGDGIILRPSVTEIPASRHESGWVVFDSGEEPIIDSAQAIGEERERRHRAITGAE